MRVACVCVHSVKCVHVRHLAVMHYFRQLKQLIFSSIKYENDLPKYQFRFGNDSRTHNQNYEVIIMLFTLPHWFHVPAKYQFSKIFSICG